MAKKTKARTLQALLWTTVSLLVLLVGACMASEKMQPLFGASADALGGTVERSNVVTPSPAPLPQEMEALPEASAADALLPADADPERASSYADYGINGFTDARADALSTFAVDVDTASYTHFRGDLRRGRLPDPRSVRVEEFLNYFDYDYAPPEDGALFAVHLDAAPSPFDRSRFLLRVGLKAREVPPQVRKRAHLVFLVDVSGSMSDPDKLPLAKEALHRLVGSLREGDTVALVTYAGSTGVVLEPTDVSRAWRIHRAIDSLGAGGSTAMASGLQLAYELAARNLGPGSVARIIVLSDGDANVGPVDSETMLKMNRPQIEEGVTLTTVGFGQGNYQDETMEQLADRGNGNYYYVDSVDEAERIFVEKVAGTLEVVAKDVKVQVKFDPRRVRAYRLIGYENRDIADRDFRNDRVDAGEIGSGHSVTALYEVVPVGDGLDPDAVTVRVRAKAPRGEKAKETVYRLGAADVHPSLEAAPRDFAFAAAVAGAAEHLRGSAFAAAWSPALIQELACGSAGSDRRKKEFCRLLQQVQTGARYAWR